MKTKLIKGFDNSIRKVYDLDGSGHMMVKDFFNGHLGKIMFDKLNLNNNNNDECLELEKFV